MKIKRNVKRDQLCIYTCDSMNIEGKLMEREDRNEREKEVVNIYVLLKNQVPQFIFK